jgi:hypothetical protein
VTLERSGPIKRKPRKRRAPGVGCTVKERNLCRRNAVTTVNDKRMCAKHAADALFGADVRESRGGRCWLAGADIVSCNGGIQCAHIISRRYLAIRWDRRNARPLCAGHHTYYTHHPLEWEEACVAMGVPWGDLRFQALNDAPMDPEAVVASYQMPVPAPHPTQTEDAE